MAIPSLNQIRDSLDAVWSEDLDSEHALYIARFAGPSMARDLDVLCDAETVSKPAEVLWDHMRRREATDLVGTYRVAAFDRSRQMDPRAAVATVVEALVLSARVAHRVEPGPRAVSFVLEARRRLLYAGGKRAGLCSLAADPNGTLVGGLYLSVLAIGLTASRVSVGHAQNSAAVRDIMIEDAKAILRSTPTLFPHPRLFAFVSQAHFAIAEQRDPRDRDLLRRLQRLDRELRPRNARSRATSGLIPLASALHVGDSDRAAALAQHVSSSLLEAGLTRHHEVVTQRQWLVAA